MNSMKDFLDQNMQLFGVHNIKQNIGISKWTLSTMSPNYLFEKRLSLQGWDKCCQTFCFIFIDDQVQSICALYERGVTDFLVI